MSEQPRLLSHFLIWFFRRPIFLPFRRREQMPGKESGGGHNYHAGQWQLADHDDHTDPGHLPGGDGGGRAEIEWTAAAGHGPEPGPGPGRSPANGSTPVHGVVSENSGKEINFTFPVDDRVCTIDEMMLPPAPPPPQQQHPSMGSLMYSVSHSPGSATTMAAVAAAATLLPPGAPSPMPMPTPTPTPIPTPAEAVVVVLPPPPPMHRQMEGSLASLREVQQQLVHLSSTLEPLVSVNWPRGARDAAGATHSSTPT